MNKRQSTRLDSYGRGKSEVARLFTYESRPAAISNWLVILQLWENPPFVESHYPYGVVGEDEATTLSHRAARTLAIYSRQRPAVKLQEQSILFYRVV